MSSRFCYQGELDLNGTHLKAGNKIVLRADGSRIEGAVQLTDGFKADGTVDFSNAHITGLVIFNTAKLTGIDGSAGHEPIGGIALNMTNATMDTKCETYATALGLPVRLCFVMLRSAAR